MKITQVDSKKINETLRTLLHLQIMNLKLEALFQRQVYIQIVPLFNSNNYLRNITSTVELIFSKYHRMGQLSTPELSATLISNLEQEILGKRRQRW